MSRTTKILLAIALIVVPSVLYQLVWKTCSVAVDTGSYLVNARDIASFKLPTNPSRTPLGCAIFALAGVTTKDSDSSRLLLLQLLMHGVVVLLTAYILWDLGLPLLASIGAWVLLWLPPYTDIAGDILSEASTEFFLGMVFYGAYLFVKKDSMRGLWLSGITASLVALVRPSYQLLAPFLAFVLVAILWLGRSKGTRRRLGMTAIAFVIPFLVFVMGWSLLNQARYGFFGLTYWTGLTLSTRTVNVIERLPEKYKDVREVMIKYRDAALVGRNGSHTGLLYIWPARFELKKITGKDEFEISRYLTRLNLWLILHAPMNYLVNVLRAGATFWLPSAGPRSFGESRLLQLVWSMLQLIVNSLFVLTAVLIGLILAFQRRTRIPSDRIRNVRRVFWVAIAIVAYNWVISCAFSVGDPRFASPTLFLIVTVCAITLFSGAEVWTVRRSTQRGDE